MAAVVVGRLRRQVAAPTRENIFGALQRTPARGVPTGAVKISHRKYDTVLLETDTHNVGKGAMFDNFRKYDTVLLQNENHNVRTN